MNLLLQEFDDDLDLHLLHASNPGRYPFLLETVVTGSDKKHYDILFACPEKTLVLDEGGTGIFGGTNTPDIEKDSDFLDAFDSLWRSEKSHTTGNSDLPFSGGWFVYLGYEIAQQIEHSLVLPKSHDGLPVAFATRIPAALIRDHQNGKIIVVTEADRPEIFQCICKDMTEAPGTDRAETGSDYLESPVEEDAPEQYLQSVNKIRQYIRDGDVFQVNLSRLWEAKLRPNISYNHLYQSLRETNPSPFSGLVTIPARPDCKTGYSELAILSSSPERLVRVKLNRVEARPIAGTRPRGDSKDTDIKNQEELMAHPKEQAEHIMLIDLERNDLGRVCEPGSMKVDELMVLESYSHVHHIVSNVSGMLKAGTSPGDVLKAVFPGGTITGCPKVRCMEIIAELEKAGRGAYTGSMGYVNHNGDMDFNILIRTMVKNAQHLSLRAGAGIVADSNPEKELNETRAKARGLLLALDRTDELR